MVCTDLIDFLLKSAFHLRGVGLPIQALPDIAEVR